MLFTTERNGNDTIVHVIASAGSAVEDYHIVGRGVARCRPEDVYSPGIGEEVAMARAIQDFDRQLEAVAIDRCVTVENMERVLDLMDEARVILVVPA